MQERHFWAQAVGQLAKSENEGFRNAKQNEGTLLPFKQNAIILQSEIIETPLNPIKTNFIERLKRAFITDHRVRLPLMLASREPSRKQQLTTLLPNLVKAPLELGGSTRFTTLVNRYPALH